jgi:hypothetical protein
MLKRQDNRKLIYIPVIHSGTDMGTIAADISRKGIAGLGEKSWNTHIKTVEKYWDIIAHYCDQINIETKGLKIYQDGMVADGEIAQKIIEDNRKMGSRNYAIIFRLMTKGAVIMKTEDFSLVKNEIDLYKSFSASESLLTKLIKVFIIKAKRYFLLKKRDQVIAKTIAKTLHHGETGLLFLGAYHNILDKLPADIQVVQVKEISKVKKYQKLLPFQVGKKLRFQKLMDYLVQPL